MHKENPLYSLIFNVALPVYILNSSQLSSRMGEQGPLWALLLALSLPIGYGLRSYFYEKKLSWLSIFGIVNVLFTGGLALLQVEGIWFAVKEAAFPLLIGAFAYATIFRTPLMKTLTRHAQVFDIPKINAALLEKSEAERGKLNEGEIKKGEIKKDESPLYLNEGFVNHPQLNQLFKTSTLLFAFSFLLSSVMNFVLAIWVFQPIADTLIEVERRNLLNEQVARMTWMGYVVIALPLSLFSGFIMWHLARGLSRLTGLEFMHMLQTKFQPPKNS